MLPARSWLIIAAVLGTLAVLWYAYHKGGVDCRADQAIAQLEHDKKVRGGYAKIDKATPFDADKRTAIEWLSQYGRQ